jgi:hypothetical protein
MKPLVKIKQKGVDSLSSRSFEREEEVRRKNASAAATVRACYVVS